MSHIEDTTVKVNHEEVTTWVNENKKRYIKAFFDPFQDIYDEYLAKIVQCKNIEEYIELEKTLLGPAPLSKPGKIPICLNKPETKVPAVYYFISLFLTKWAGETIRFMIEGLLGREKVAVLKYEQIKSQNEEILNECVDLKKNLTENGLINGLMVADLENRIRNLEANIIAKERIILEKNEANNILWEKIKALEEKSEQSTCNTTNMDLDNKIQNKKKRPNKKRKRAQVQHDKNGTINKIKLGAIGDRDKDRLDNHFANRSRDITFYDIPAYWSDVEIFELLNDNVGFVEYMRTKRCYKYKTVRVTLRFSNDYEKIYKEGGVNVSSTRKNRTFFLRMFDSSLTYAQIKDKFRWQASKQLGEDVQHDDVLVIKEYVKIYRAFFGKIIRVNGRRFLFLYFNKETDLMDAINDSIKLHDLGNGLWIKKPTDFIDNTGNLQEHIGRMGYQNEASSASGSSMDNNNKIRDFGPPRPRKQWR